MKILFIALLIAFPFAASADCLCHHYRHHWYYQGYHREDIYRHGPPENGGYRAGYYGGRYHDNTYYPD